MYSGTLSLSSPADLNVLNQQIELLAAINSQLKEFSSLKSNVAGIFEIFKKGTSSVSDTTKATKEAADAGNELNLVSQTEAALMSGLAEGTSQCADAVTEASKASGIFGSITNLTAMQVTALIIAITAVIAAISALVKWYNRTNEAGEAAKASAEDLMTAHENLSQSVADTENAYSKTCASLDTAGAKAHSLTERLEALRDKTKRTKEEDQEMALILNDLTSEYSGLNEYIDENTGALTGNAEQWNAVIDSQLNYERAMATLTHSKELIDQATEAELNLATAKQMVSDNEKKLQQNTEQRNKLDAEANKIYQQLLDGTERTAEETQELSQKYQELCGESESLRLESNGLKDANKTLGKGMDELSDTAKRLQAEQEASAKLAQQQAQAVLDSYLTQIDAVKTYEEISGQMTDEEIANVRSLIDAGAVLEQSELAKFESIEAARAAEIVAEQDYVKAIRDGQVEITAAEAERIEAKRKAGEELTEIEQATLDRWNEMQDEWAQGVQKNTDTIINGMRELPTEMEYSLDDMIRIVNENAQKYDAWREKMAAVSGQLTPEVMAYLEELGPGTTAILDEIINDTTGTKAAELNAAFGYAGEAALNGMYKGMDKGAGAVYQKTAEIGGNVARKMRSTLAVKSPSRVMTDIFKNVMLGVIKGMDDMKDKTYATAAGIANGVADRLTLTPDQAGLANAKLLALSSTSLSSAPSAKAAYGMTDRFGGESGEAGLLRRAVDILDEYLPEVANMQVVLDTGAGKKNWNGAGAKNVAAERKNDALGMRGEVNSGRNTQGKGFDWARFEKKGGVLQRWSRENLALGALIV